MIVRIKFKTDTDEYTMLFGDSYKKWFTQFEEYISRYKVYDFSNVALSKSKWIGWGGLKWCNENEFQHELNREGCQSYDLNNPRPRKYDEMIFNDSVYVKSKIKNIIDSRKIINEIIEARNKEWKTKKQI